MPSDAWQLRSVPVGLGERYVAEGWWTEDSLGDMVGAGLASMRDVSFNVHSQLRPWRGTFADVDESARALAATLASRGVGPGDVLVFQLPNWLEAGITFWAAAYLGAVVVPVVHFYGEKEVGHILRTVQPEVFVTAASFGPLEHLATHHALVSGLDRAPTWLVVGEDLDLPPGAEPFEAALGHDRIDGPLPVDPDAPAVVGFTSGTTRDPKGVIHSHRTIGFETRQLAGVVPDFGPPGHHRCARRPLHRDAQRLPDAAGQGASRQPPRCVGSRDGPPADARGGSLPRWRSHVLPHQRAGPSRLHARAPHPHALLRPRWLHRPRRGHGASRVARHQGLPCLRQHRTPVDHVVHHRRPGGQAAHDRRSSDGRGRDPPRRRRPDLQSWSRLLPGLHRSRIDRDGVRGRRRGTARATSASSTRTGT